MLSIEEARRELYNPLGDTTHPEAQCCMTWADAYALAVLESYVAEVDRVAEADMSAGNPLTGAHYRAMRTVAAKHRARIERLGK